MCSAPLLLYYRPVRAFSMTDMLVYVRRHPFSYWGHVAGGVATLACLTLLAIVLAARRSHAGWVACTLAALTLGLSAFTGRALERGWATEPLPYYVLHGMATPVVVTILVAFVAFLAFTKRTVQ